MGYLPCKFMRDLYIATIYRSGAIFSHSHCRSIFIRRFYAYDLSNGEIFYDFTRPLSAVSRSRHSLTLNISETAQDTDIVSTEY